MPTDPVCGMFVPENSELFIEENGQKFFFCSRGCLEKFKSPEAEQKKLKIRLSIGWIFSIPVMILSYLDLGFYRNYLILALTLPIQFYSGLSFYNGAYHAVKSFSGNMDLLISIGTLTAFTFSTFLTFFPNFLESSGVYFDASAFIITLILTGNYIENLTKTRANRAASRLIEMLPSVAHLIVDGEIRDVKTNEVSVSDKILIKPGEIISVDGTIFDGKSEIDESMMTGEQMPILKSAGENVSSGTRNLNGTIKIEVKKTGKDTTISQIYDMIQRAATGRVKIQRIADVFSARFVPLVLIIASTASIFWLFDLLYSGRGLSIEIPVLVFVSVVIIACPCAIGLAGPITLLISSNLSSEKGIVVKNASALDRLSKATLVMFDKTGTLTSPEPVVKEFNLIGDFDEGHIMSLAASVESLSNHPVAKAIVKFTGSKNVRNLPVSDFEEIPGYGVKGLIGNDRVEISRSRINGSSRVRVVVNDEEAAYLSLSYELRDTAVEALELLRSINIKPSIVTGDSSVEAERVAGILKIKDVHSSVQPGEKADIVKNYQMKGDYVIFVGDGINDSIALETADVGIAMASGTDIARESGDIILLNNDLRHIYFSKIIGDKTIAKIRQNIYWAIGYNSALIPVAAGLLVPLIGLAIYSILPILAAFAMGFSSSSVVLNSLLLRRSVSKYMIHEKQK